MAGLPGPSRRHHAANRCVVPAFDRYIGNSHLIISHHGEIGVGTVLQRALIGPGSGRPRAMLAVQAAHGHLVTRLVRRRDGGPLQRAKQLSWPCQPVGG
jgi:hypothetical protein